MQSPNRRAFLRQSAGGLASVLFVGHGASAADPLPVAPAPRPVETVPTNLTPNDTLFLTWFRDPTTTMAVQWIGPSKDAPTSVRAAERTGEEWKTATITSAPFGRTDLKVFRAEFTGLTAGTEYIFQLGKGPQTYRFRTCPAKATDTFTWVSGGDCGTGPAAVRTNQIAAKQEPHFALICGDLGYDNGVSAKTALTFAQNYAKTMTDPKGRLIPLVCGIGNHEVRGGFKGKREDATYFLPQFDGFFKEKTYGTFDFGNYLSLVILDSGHVEPIGGEQTDWLDEQLAEREGRPHLFVANHVPAYPSYRAPETGLLTNKFGTGEAQRLHWCPLFEKYRVDAVLEHHDHTFKRTHPLTGGLVDKYGVPYLGDGSWGMLRTPVSPEKRPYLAKVGKVNQMTVHRLEGEDRYHVAIDDTGKVADVYATCGKRPAKRG